MSKKMIGRRVVNGTLMCVVDSAPYTIDPSHPNYKKLKDAFNASNAEQFLDNLDVVTAAVNSIKNTVGVNSGITVDSSGVYLNGKPVHNTVSNAIMNMMRGGYDFKPLVKFLERVLKNPSKRSVDELWGFLEACGLVITDDGCFLAYKSVRENYLDKYSGTFDNRPGAKLRMERNQVDDDFTRTCSHGFHVGALAYSGPQGWYHNHGDKVVICKVAPEDVVSVPADHNGQKLRTCAYEVVGDYKAPLNAPVYSGKVGDSYDSVVMNEEDFTDEIPSDELLVGHSYEFTYVNVDGEEEDRTGVFLNYENDRAKFIMGAGDKSEFQYRTFNTDYISDVFETTVEVSVKY